MTITTNPESLVARLNAASPNTLADQLRLVGFGTILRQLGTALRRANPFGAAANPYVGLSTVNVLTLPDDAKARGISRVYARAQDASESTGSVGELTIKTPYGTTPTTGTVGVSASGDLMFLKTDAFNDVDIEYDVAKQDVFELVVNVVPGTGILTIPAKYAGAAAPGTGLAPGVLMLLEAEALAGTVTGKCAVLVPGTNPGTTQQANLSANKMQVLFKVSDAVTQARIKIGVASGSVTYPQGGQPPAVGGVDLNALLEAPSPNY
jgi:hypothetical protein